MSCTEATSVAIVMALLLNEYLLQHIFAPRLFVCFLLGRTSRTCHQHGALTSRASHVLREWSRLVGSLNRNEVQVFLQVISLTSRKWLLGEADDTIQTSKSPRVIVDGCIDTLSLSKEGHCIWKNTLCASESKELRDTREKKAAAF